MKFLSAFESDSEFVAFVVFDSVFGNLSKVMVGKLGVVNCDGGVTCVNNECLLLKSAQYKVKHICARGGGLLLGMASQDSRRSLCNKFDQAFRRKFDQRVDIGG